MRDCYTFVNEKVWMLKSATTNTMLKLKLPQNNAYRETFQKIHFSTTILFMYKLVTSVKKMLKKDV